MKKITPQDKILLNRLASGNIAEVKVAISTIKQEGHGRLVPDILSIYNSVTSEEILKELEGMLVDLKLQESVLPIVDAIQNEKFAQSKQFLISLAWQTGLDFSAFADVFMSILIKEDDFMLAFEAFTVLENMDAYYSKMDLATYIEQLKQASLSTREEKQGLMVDLIHAFGG